MSTKENTMILMALDITCKFAVTETIKITIFVDRYFIYEIRIYVYSIFILQCSSSYHAIIVIINILRFYIIILVLTIENNF